LEPTFLEKMNPKMTNKKSPEKKNMTNNENDVYHLIFKLIF
jgi:hypothetical protein